MANIDLRNRAPSVTRTRDFRNHVERVYDVLNFIPKTPAEILAECWLPLGTVDELYTDCYLTDQKVTGQDGPFKEPCLEPPKLIRVFEQLNGLNETLIGNPNITIDQDGHKSVDLLYMQLSSGTATYLVPGTSVAPAPNTDCILREQVDSDDGTIRQIKRNYISFGTISQTDETRNEGALLLRTIVSIGTLPATPAGYTLISAKVDHPGGLPVYAYTFAKGLGTIDTQVETKNGGKLVLYRITALGGAPSAPSPTIGGTVTLISTDVKQEDGYDLYDYQWAEGIGEISRAIEYSESVNQGTAGVTKTTIRYLVAPAATVQPTSLSGSIEVGRTFEESDGYRIWTTTWAKGAGTVDTTVQTREGGKLILYGITALGSAPSAPSPTIGGTVTLISTDVRIESGYTLYDYRWAEGLGEISRDIAYSQSVDQGTAGVTRTTIRYLVAPGGTILPTSLSGSIEIGRTYEDLDGYRAWTTVWAKGVGTVDTQVDTKNGGKLILYRITALGSAPSAPSPTIGGTVTLIDSDVKTDGGYTLYDYQWAEGLGELSRDTDYRESPDAGTTGLIVTTIRYLSAVATVVNPISTPGGTTIISSTYASQDGYKIWSGIYAAGTGTVMSQVDTRNNGKLIIYSKKAINGAPSAPSPTIGGTVNLISAETKNGTDVENGTVIYTYQWAEGKGRISEDIVERQDGLREVTYISLGAREAPSGIVIRDDLDQQTGYTLYRVTSMQAADGGTVTSAAVTFERFVPFLYPGVAKAYSLTAENGWLAYDVFRRPPVQTDVKATVNVSYTTSASLGTISDYWNPDEWATIEAQWIGLNNIPGYEILALPGYRSFSDTPLVFTASVWEDGVAGTMLGNVVFGGTTAVVTVYGGPVDPGGSTWTLDASIEPAFISTTGVQYYRKTLVTAAIPTQPALPV